MINHIPFMLIITHISFFIIVTTSNSQQPPQSVYNYSNCKDINNSYNCGNISDISYPFWGQSRPLHCGAGNPFYLNCHNNTTTTILLSSQNFTVLEINTKHHIIKLKRTDLDQNLCSPQFNDTYLSPPLFKCPPSVNHTITIYYNCTSKSSTVSQYLAKNSLCGSNSPSLGHVGDEDKLFEEDPSLKCQKHIKVPAGAYSPLEMDYFEGGKLKRVLNEGFEVKYTVNEECLRCLGSEGGDCLNDSIDKHVELCYYDNLTDGSIASSTNRSSHDKTRWNWKRKLVIAVVSSVLGSFAVLNAIYIFYRHRKNKSFANSNVKSRSFPSDFFSKDLQRGKTKRGSKHFGGGQIIGVQHFTYSELEEATNYFDPSRGLGKGGFGTVYFGKLHDGRSVAVKRLYEKSYKRVQQFMNEVHILARLVHPNLVSLYGCTSRHSRVLLLAYEYVSNGTVADHLNGNQAKHGKLSWHIRMNIAVETASALKYLHVSDIIHRDIKTNNILLDTHFRVKVADFGLSRLFPIDHTHVSTAPQGTPGYLDPEYYAHSHLTHKSDVYSFGVVMIELISSLPAVDVKRPRDDINLSTMAMNKIQNQALHELVDPTLGFDTDSKVNEMINAVAELAFRCLQSSKDMRPCMDEVLKTLQDIQGAGANESQRETANISNSHDDIVLCNYDPRPVAYPGPWIRGCKIFNFIITIL